MCRGGFLADELGLAGWSGPNLGREFTHTCITSSRQSQKRTRMQEMSNLQCWCDAQLVIDSERGLLEE
jgi:hypothetical protein